jgi:pre-mRNA-splicing factor ISY1
MIRKEARKAVRSGEVAEVTTAAREILHEEEEDVVEEERIKDREMRERLDEKEREFVVHVPLPDEKEIEKMVLQKKKADLLNRYVSDVLMEEQTEAKDLLNIHR